MDYFAKKQWIRIAVCAVLVAAIVLAMTGVFGKAGDLVYPLPTQDATEKGFGGDVTAHVRLNDDNTVQTLTIETPDETEGLGKRVSDEEFTAQFIGKSAPFAFGEDGIEALSGATITSKAALKAINRAVTGEETAEPEEAKTETTTVTGELTDGVYSSTKENAFSTVTVIATAENGKLTDVQITSEGEAGNDLMTDAIREEWAKAILESGSATPDAITSASLTFSAGSVQEAMTEILDRMGGQETAAEEETAAEAPVEEVPAEEAPAEETAAEEESAGETGTETTTVTGELTDGVYSSTKENAFSTVTVIATAENGKLKDVQITSEGEAGKDLMTDAIREEWAKAILESGSATPDAITSATLTFSAGSVQEAMTEILDRMGGQGTATEEETAAEAPVEEVPAEEAPAEETAAEEAPAEAVPAEETAAPEAEAPAKDTPASAAYRATATNAFSTVTVIASTKDGKLASVKILSEGEEGKDLMTDAIREEWAKAILESGSATPDAITSASLTFSAGSVQEAMTEILDRMGSQEPAAEEETAAEAPAEEVPAEEVPAEEVPAEEVPAEEAATEETPAEVTAEETTAEEKPVEETAAEAETAPEAEIPAKAVPASAAYRATATNAFSTVTVIASAKDGKLESVKILSEGEAGKDLMTDTIREEWAKAILESGSATPDAITGATLTFSAGSVQEAMTEILDRMGGQEPAAEETAADTAEQTPAEEAATGETPEETGVEETTTEAAEAEETPAEETAASETEASEKAAPASAAYRATATNAFSTVTVIASTKDGKLASVKILSEGEEGKDLMTDAIREEWAKAILESGNASPDAITGATLKFSAASVQEAMTEILGRMGSQEPEAAEKTAAEEASAEDATDGETPAEAQAPAAEATPKTPPAFAGYRVEKENTFSRITVIACASSGKLTSLKILSEGDDGKDLLTDAIREEWAKAILESQSASPDAITGATLTFSAGSVQEAAAEILEKAAGK